MNHAKNRTLVTCTSVYILALTLAAVLVRKCYINSVHICVCVALLSTYWALQLGCYKETGDIHHMVFEAYEAPVIID